MMMIRWFQSCNFCTFHNQQNVKNNTRRHNSQQMVSGTFICMQKFCISWKMVCWKQRTNRFLCMQKKKLFVSFLQLVGGCMEMMMKERKKRVLNVKLLFSYTDADKNIFIARKCSFVASSPKTKNIFSSSSFPIIFLRLSLPKREWNMMSKCLWTIPTAILEESLIKTFHFPSFHLIQFIFPFSPSSSFIVQQQKKINLQ